MTTSTTKKNEIMLMLIASRFDSQTPGMPYSWTNDAKPILIEMGIRPLPVAQFNLRKAGMLKRIASGQHRLTKAGRFATLSLGSAPWRRP
jgi:hypothetical protein